MRVAATLIFSLVMMTAAAFAQQNAEEQQLGEWMESINQLNGQLGYYLKEKDGPESAKAAGQMQQVFAQVQTFFESKKITTATQYAKGALAGFKETEDLAAAGKLPEALQKYYDTRANCENCHKEHRVRGEDGNWKVKY